MLRSQLGTEVRKSGSSNQGIGCGDGEKQTDYKDNVYGEEEEKEEHTYTPLTLCEALDV